MSNKIDLLFPCHEKDKDSLYLAIEFAKKNIKDLNKIYVVSKIKLTENAIWISEDSLPFSFQDVVNIIGNHNRTAWYYAGLITICSTMYLDQLEENVLICDSDNIFIRPVEFINDEGKSLYSLSPGDGTDLYDEHMQYLVPGLQKQIPRPWSGICHHMLMNKKISNHLKDFVENKNNKPFWKVYLEITLKNYKSWPHSNVKKLGKKSILDGPGRAGDYEIYFNYAKKYFPDKVKVRKLNSIMSYKGYINVKGGNFTKGEKSRTNLRDRLQIIDPKLEKQKVFDTIEESFRWHISKCIEKKFDSITFQNHQRQGSNNITGNGHGDKR